MLLFHVLLLPVALAALIAGHLILVRRRGVVPPFPAAGASVPDPGVVAPAERRSGGASS